MLSLCVVRISCWFRASGLHQLSTLLQILQGLPDHLALDILCSSNTSLSACIRVLPVSLLPLALEALCPSIRTNKHLSLEDLIPPSSSADKATVLRAAATFTCLESLHLSSNWTPPCVRDVENSLKHLLHSLHPTLKKLQMYSQEAAECLISSVSTLRSLESFVLKPDKITRATRHCFSLQTCLKSLHALPTLRSIVLHNVPDDSDLHCSLGGEHLQGLCGLTQLDLRCRLPVGSSLSPVLSSLCSRADTLKSLHLQPFCYDEVHVLAFPWQPTALLSIAQLQGLTSLTLGRVYGAGVFAPSGPHSGRHTESIQERYAAVSAALVQALARLQNLHFLELDGYCVKCQFYERLAKSISTMKQLRSLKFVQFYEQSDALWLALSQGASFPTKLKNLQLLKVYLSSLSQRNIGSLLLRVTELQELCIDFCPLHDRPDQFWEGVAQLSTLQALSLCGNVLFAADVERIANCCASLTRLDLCGNSLRIRFETFKALVSSSPKLRVLSLMRDDIADSAAFELEVEKVVSSQIERSVNHSVLCWDQWPAHLAEQTGFADASNFTMFDSDNVCDDWEFLCVYGH